MKRPRLPAFLRKLFAERLPRGVGWPHVLGSALLAALALMAFTGVLLALGYAPATAAAWESVRGIEQDRWGRLVRGLHHWGDSAAIVLAALHLARTYLYAAYRPPRRWTWVAGVGLLLVLLGFGLTGYLLPWDMKAYFGTRVATAIPASLPVVGPALGRLIRGASDVGDLTLTRFYAVHVILLPAALVGLVVAHLVLVRRHGITPPFADAAEEDEAPRERTFFPFHAWKDSLAILVVVGILLYLAARHGAPLEARADPTDSAYVPRPEWYFLGLQHLLRVFTGPWQILATAVLPGAAVTLLLLLPWIDRRRSRRLRRRPVALALGAVAAVSVAGLTLAGHRAVAREETRLAQRQAAGEPQADAAPDTVAADLAARGEELYADLRCASCHGPDRRPVIPGLPPDLSYAGSKLQQGWTAAYLLDPAPIRWLRQGERPALRMPDFRLTDPEAAALAAALAQRRSPERFASGVADSALASASAADGKRFFEQYRCRGCHVLDGRGSQVGPDLTGVGRRLRPEYLYAFLKDPEAVIPGTPMRDLDLWPEEAAALAEFLREQR